MMLRNPLTPLNHIEDINIYYKAQAERLNHGEISSPLLLYIETIKHIKEIIFKLKQSALIKNIYEIQTSFEQSLIFYTTNTAAIREITRLIIGNLETQLNSSRRKISYESITKEVQKNLTSLQPDQPVEFLNLYMLIKETYLKFSEHTESIYDNLNMEKLKEFDSLLSISVLKTIDIQADYRNQFETELLQLLLTKISPHDFFMKILEVTRLSFDSKNEDARQALEMLKDTLDHVINQWKSDKLPEVLELIRFDDLKQKYLDQITNRYMSATLPNHLDVTAKIGKEIDEKQITPSTFPEPILRKKEDVLLKMAEKNQIHAFTITIKSVRSVETLEFLKKKISEDPEKRSFLKMITHQIDSLSKSNPSSSFRYKVFKPVQDASATDSNSQIRLKVLVK